MEKNRLEISRLFNRFGFGPKPGEFAADLKAGLKKTQNKILKISENDPGLIDTKDLTLTDLGPRPKPNSAEIINFATSRRNEKDQLTLWWLRPYGFRKLRPKRKNDLVLAWSLGNLNKKSRFSTSYV